MAVDTLPTSLNHSVQQHARNLHSQLHQTLGSIPNSASVDNVSSSAAELRQLVACNAKLARALAGSNTTAQAQAPAPAAAPSTDDAEELRKSCQRRQELLQELLQTLDSSAQGLRSHLDACHKLLSIPPCKEDPDSIIRYAHTLRHGFAPLGSAPNLPPVPPAPQLPFMLHSTLRLYHMDLAAQQQQQQGAPPPSQLPAAAAAGLQPQPLAAPTGATEAAAGAAATTAVPAGAQAGTAEAAAPAAPAAAAGAQMMQFRLNEDLDEEFDIGETASEEESWSDEDDEDDTE